MSDLSTRLIHHPYRPPEGYDAPQPGVFKASTIFFRDVATMRARYAGGKETYSYGLHGTPTSFLLQERLCELEGGLHCQLLPSGLSAIATVNLALLKTGDEMLIPDNVYGPSKVQADGELAAFGISYGLYDPANPQDLAAKISERTRLVWIEAPGSVTMEFPDLAGIVRVCKAAGVTCVLDNTWGAGLAFRPFELGDGLAVDVSVQALTKYPSGGGDVLMGSVITRDDALARKLMLSRRRLGVGVGMNDIEAILRSLPSIDLRYRAHDAAARELARWLGGREEIVQVLHPALVGSPGHEHWKSVCAAGGHRAAGLFSVMFHPRYGQGQIDAFCDALQLFKLGFSWGGPISLAVPYELAGMRSAWPAHIQRGSLVRFSIGLEQVDDLRADLLQALEQPIFRAAN